MEINSIQDLLRDVSHYIGNKSSSSFSVFEMLGQSDRELTHSSFIAQLLNPDGSHQQGAIFLDKFLEVLNIDCEFKSNNAIVEIEKDFGPKTGKGECAFGGRIDIYLKDAHGKEIVIENKIFARDQEDQLQRYRNSTNPNSTILYLTLDGHSASNTPPSVKYFRISYKEHIIAWIEKCLEESKENYALNNVICQYMDTVNNLISDQNISEIIQQSSSNMKASLRIARLADKSRNNLKKLFLEDLAKHLNLDNEPEPVGKEHRLQASDCEWCIEYNLFIRFYKPDGMKIKSWRKSHNEDCVGDFNWIYVKIDSDLINFQEFNKWASLWIDDPNAFWRKFETILQEIQNHFEL